jgi:hypothetical protein
MAAFGMTLSKLTPDLYQALSADTESATEGEEHH